MPDFVAYPSRWRIALLILVSVGFVVGGLWMGGVLGPVEGTNRYSAEMVYVIGWVTVIFFGACGVALLTRLFETGERLRIGPSGIWLAGRPDLNIPWAEIADVTIWRVHGQKSIVIHLHDLSRFPGRGSARWLVSVNRQLTGGDIAISLVGTDRSCEEAMAAIRRFRR